MRSNLYIKYYKIINKTKSQNNKQNFYLNFEKCIYITPIGFLDYNGDKINIDLFSIYQNLKIIYYFNSGNNKDGIIPQFRYDMTLYGKNLIKLSDLYNLVEYENFLEKSIISLDRKEEIDFKIQKFDSKSDKFKLQSNNFITDFFVFNLNFHKISVL